MNPIATDRLGKWATQIEMVRVIARLMEELDDNGLLTAALKARADNATTGFLATAPQKVRDELREG